MKWLMLLRISAFTLGIAVPMMLPAFVMALVSGEFLLIRAFAVPLGITLGCVLPALWAYKKTRFHFGPQDGFFLVFLSWIGISLLGALPYYLAGEGISFTDAVFESACGFATTGASTFSDVESLPYSLLFWRSTTHWFGGMGIILLTVALMPLMGVGGFQLIKAETPGPETEKITPKITATAKILWLVYCGLTLILFLLYLLGGMSGFDAICHAFTTMATGGVSTKNKGISFYDSPFIDLISTVFMLLAGLNFNLYVRVLKGTFKDLWHNSEARAYVLIFIIASGLITLSLVQVYGSVGRAARYGVYQAASILSTTGTAITDYAAWPSLAQGTLFILMFIGGCSGSTAGGVKVIRHVVLWKQTGNELRRLIYPQGIFSVQLNRKVGRKDVVYGVAGFGFLYLMVIAATTLITAASGIELYSAFSAAIAVTGNIGVGFGVIGPCGTYGAFPDHIKWIFSLVMIAGRLELWTVFVLFSPEYWRR
ncbi:MAG: TrkH family potassium uptake protein [Treponema sp.]|jgi:trk system potassium uptake protein TrkH|nr:TrkH family potassium uptake protein [Treponema sp.]